MKEHGIIFSGPMVRAILTILKGRKTQTRRVIIPQPEDMKPLGPAGQLIPYKRGKPVADMSGVPVWEPINCPYGIVGDRLYVREAFWDKGSWQSDENFKRHWERWPPEEEKIDFYYDADGKPTQIRGSYTPFGSCVYLRKHPSIHMKKDDARTWLEITDIRAERVQDISEEDAITEGIEQSTAHGEPAYYLYDERLHYTPNPIESFETLWDSIKAKRGYGWQNNPWVWAITFRKL